MAGEVFANRSCEGLPAFNLTVFGDVRGVVRTDLGLTMQVEHGLERLSVADLVVLLPGDGCHQVEPSASLVAALRASHDRGAIVVSHCVGSYLLAATGLLDGARATTHWRLAADFAARFPDVKVEPGVLYVDEGRIISGAGATTGTGCGTRVVGSYPRMCNYRDIHGPWECYDDLIGASGGTLTGGGDSGGAWFTRADPNDPHWTQVSAVGSHTGYQALDGQMVFQDIGTATRDWPGLTMITW